MENENIAEVVLFDTTKPKKIKLAKINRTLNCIFCNDERILNPNQYQSYYDYWGDEEKIKRNFICKPCEMKQNENPFLFWLQNHEFTRKINRSLKSIFETYKVSGKQQVDILLLQNNTMEKMLEYKIDANNVKFLIENSLPVGIEITHMPFVGTFQFRPYDTDKIKTV